MIGCIKIGNYKLRTRFFNQIGQKTRIPTPISCQSKELWIQYTNKEVAKTAQNLGISKLLVDEEQFQKDDVFHKFITAIGGDPSSIFQILDAGKLQTYLVGDKKELSGCLPITSGADNQLVGLYLFEFSEDIARAIKSIPFDLFVVLKLEDWKIIPVENAIAQLSDASGENNKIVPVYPVVNSVEEAALMLNVLEKGSNGVVMQTQNPHQVEEMCQFMSDQQSNYIKSTQLSLASISKVSEVDGLCDRVCVDVCSMMVPGEGMLVGCFSRGLFLVHSECEESGYINSRPFRVNAGAVSCYVQCPDGRTQYLSEIQCGSEVAIFDVNGKETKAIVGRSKIEQRPMVIIEAIVEGDEGDSISVVLQNAETVKLCGPADTGGWRTIPVTEMKLGDKVFVQCIGGARHTGIVVQESIIEK